MATKFDQTIFETPENWGETTVANAEKMNETISEIQKLGDDWASCEINDCKEYQFVADVNGVGLYSTFYNNERGYSYELYKTDGDGFYTFVKNAQFFGRDDQQAIAEAQEFLS